MAGKFAKRVHVVGGDESPTLVLKEELVDGTLVGVYELVKKGTAKVNPDTGAVTIVEPKKKKR